MCSSPETDTGIQGEVAPVGTEEVVGVEPSIPDVIDPKKLDPKGRVPIIHY